MDKRHFTLKFFEQTGLLVEVKGNKFIRWPTNFPRDFNGNTLKGVSDALFGEQDVELAFYELQPVEDHRSKRLYTVQNRQSAPGSELYLLQQAAREQRLLARLGLTLGDVKSQAQIVEEQTALIEVLSATMSEPKSDERSIDLLAGLLEESDAIPERSRNVLEESLKSLRLAGAESNRDVLLALVADLITAVRAFERESLRGAGE